MRTPFNIPLLSGKEVPILTELIKANKFCGDGAYTKECNKILEQLTGCNKVLLTTSCTHALEMSALLQNIKQGDEIIMPSFTFVSSANSFVLRGAKIIFVDIDPLTMNINAELIEEAITVRTKAVVIMHYGGISCQMDRIITIAQKYSLCIIEDAAQCIDAYYENRHLGTMGDFGTISFHETKNIHCGEGGALLINKKGQEDRAEILREKGTDRSKFIAGLIDKYTWVDIGSSYLPSEFNAAVLISQLQKVKEVTNKRLLLWERYNQNLYNLKIQGYIELPFVPEYSTHNAHLYYIKCKNGQERASLIEYLKKNKIQASFHYIPLHSSPAGLHFGSFVGADMFTTKESERLLRLPLYYLLSPGEVDRISEMVKSFYEQ